MTDHTGFGAYTPVRIIGRKAKQALTDMMQEKQEELKVFAERIKFSRLLLVPTRSGS